MDSKKLIEGKALSLKTKSLDSIINDAMHKIGVLKEADLCLYIPYGNEVLSPSKFLSLKETKKEELAFLIRQHILEKDPVRALSSQTAMAGAFRENKNKLEIAIKAAMNKVKTLKEIDLCRYIPYKNARIHHYTFWRLKKENPYELWNMIQHHILLKNPQKYVRKYMKNPQDQIDENSLEGVIAKALKRRKLKLKREENISKYLIYKGSRLHPKIFQKLKENDPKLLKELIQTYVLEPRHPKIVKRQLSKNSEDDDFSNLTENSSQIFQPSKIDQILEKTSQSFDVMCRLLQTLQNQVELSPKDSHLSSEQSQQNRYLRTVQNQLIEQIRKKQVNFELWDMYVDLVQ